MRPADPPVLFLAVISQGTAKQNNDIAATYPGANEDNHGLSLC